MANFEFMFEDNHVAGGTLDSIGECVFALQKLFHFHN
jgi:hypothetical protein